MTTTTTPPAVDQCDAMDYIDEELAAILGQDFPGSLSSPSVGDAASASSSLVCIPPTGEPPPRQQKPGRSNFSSPTGVSDLDGASSAQLVLNFANRTRSPDNSQQAPFGNRNPDEEAAVVSRISRNHGQGSKAAKRMCTDKVAGRRVRPASQAFDHIMAERRRRELLSQCFVALSTLVPGLKKMDKTSVLGNTISYLKLLQERVKSLEEQSAAAKQTMESAVLVKRSQIAEDEGSSDEKSSWTGGQDEEQSLPEIEARVCDRSVLIKIHCQKRKGFLVKVLAQVENLNLSVVNTNVTPFGSLALDITVVAEMDKETSLTAKDIVRSLRSALVAAAAN